MKKVLLFILTYILVTSCGFEVVNRTQLANYDINEIVSTGDKRINFKIKNKILFGSQKR